MGTTWGYGPVEFEVTADADTIVELRVPHRGTIKAINFQHSDASAGGEIEIYDSEKVIAQLDTDLASSLSLSSEASDPNAAAFSVTGPLAVASGSYREHDLNFSYINRDGTSTNPVRKLYMRVNVDNAGPHTLSMTIEPADLSS